MSDAFITRRGGGSGLSMLGAVLHVNAPVGSTITLAKGGVVAKVLGPEKSHVNSADASLADWYYAVSSSNYGVWTVTATSNTDTASDTVTIDSNKQYDVELTYHYYLYKNGDQYTDITGGWVKETASGASVSFESDHIHGITSSTIYPVWCTYANNKIDVTNYASLSFLYSGTAVDTYGQIANSKGYLDSGVAKIAMPDTSEQTVVSLSLANVSGTYYIGISHMSGGGDKDIFAVWLDK